MTKYGNLALRGKIKRNGQFAKQKVILACEFICSFFQGQRPHERTMLHFRGRVPHAAEVMTQADLDQDLGEDFQAFDKENIISESFVEQDLYDYYDTHRASNRTNYVDHNALWMPQKNIFDSRTPLRTRSMRPYSTTTSKPIPAR
jgi:hypothetical protein